MSHKNRTDKNLVMKNSSISISECTRYSSPDENGDPEKPFSYIMLQDNFTRNLIILYKDEVEELIKVLATWLNSYKVQDTDSGVRFQPASVGNILGYLTKGELEWTSPRQRKEGALTDDSLGPQLGE